MHLKMIVFSLLFALLSFGCAGLDAFAADISPDEIFFAEISTEKNDTEIQEELIDIIAEDATADISADISADILAALQQNTLELQEVNQELDNISALLLILVVFETMRIVRSWSKGAGVK